MVNRNDTNIARKPDTNLESGTSSLHSFNSENSHTRKLIVRNSSVSDDLIRSLSNAYENKRARQVSEWERLFNRRWHRAVL